VDPRARRRGPQGNRGRVLRPAQAPAADGRRRRSRARSRQDSRHHRPRARAQPARLPGCGRRGRSQGHADGLGLRGPQHEQHPHDLRPGAGIGGEDRALQERASRRQSSSHRGGCLHRVRLHAAGRRGRGLGDRDGREVRRSGRGLRRPFRFRRLRQPHASQAHVHALESRARRQGGRSASPQHARPRPRQRRGRARRGA